MASTKRAAPRRGEIWMVDSGTPVGHEQGFRRPVVVISDDRLNRSRTELAIVVPVTSTRRGRPSHVELDAGRGTGLREVSYAKAEDVKSISRQRLARRLGEVPADGLAALEQALRLLLDL
jgi:mRNA interferase MazF